MSYQDIVRGFLGCGWHSDEGASICLTTSESRRHAAFCSIDPFTTWTNRTHSHLVAATAERAFLLPSDSARDA